MNTKSIVIDFIILDKLKLSIKEFIFLIWLKTSLEEFNIFNKNDLEISSIKKDLEDKKYIKLNDNLEAELRQSGIDLIDFLSIDSFKDFNSTKIIKKSKRTISAEVVGRINEYRDKWKGLKPGSMGSKQSCIDKLSRWMENNPEYSFEDILFAANLYLNTEGTNLRFLQKADFFIYKQENNKEESSRLSAFIDEIDIEVESDWTSNLN